MKLKIPNEVQENQIEKSNIIRQFNANIKEILEEILKVQSENIDNKNENHIKELIGKADLIITECHTTKIFNTNKNEQFNRLVYEFQRLNLKYESYQINQQIKSVKGEYKEIQHNQENIKNETNNLVYNILGFIASFSIISASVEAISKINGTLNIMLFMAFAILLLLTALIGLHNFYKSGNKRQNRLQNNYFLWKAVFIIVICLLIIIGIRFALNNIDIVVDFINRIK